MQTLAKTASVSTETARCPRQAASAESAWESNANIMLEVATAQVAERHTKKLRCQRNAAEHL